jgi:hypothetical protein
MGLHGLLTNYEAALYEIFSSLSVTSAPLDPQLYTLNIHGSLEMSVPELFSDLVAWNLANYKLSVVTSHANISITRYA